MKRLVYAFLILVAMAHHDFWWWDDSDTLVFGFMPVGLAYHAGVSVAAAIGWALAVRYCWPTDIDEPDASTSGTNGAGGGPP